MARWPVHQNPKEEHAAKAPYNFVPLPERVVTVDPLKLPDQDAYYPDRYTGRIACELTTASPLYVRAALDADEFRKSQDPEQSQLPFRERVKNEPSFFYTQHKARPVIPGSSLRGLLRALVEIVSHGKMQWVADRQLVYRAVGDTTSHGEAYRERLMRYDGDGYEDGKRYYSYTPLMRAGYMEQKTNGDWIICPAQEIDGTTFARISNRKIPGGLQPWKRSQNASMIWVQPGRYDYQKVRGGFIRIKYARALRASASPERGLIEARLVRSGWMANKRSEAVVYEIDRAAPTIDVDDDLVQAYKAQLAQIYTQQALRGRKQEGMLGPSGVLESGQPVFYLVEGGKLIFFGHCMMFRLPYRLSPVDFIPESLRRETDTDLAEAIFGYTKRLDESRWPDEKIPPKERAYAGRVFVSDAQLAESTQGDVWLTGKEGLAPKILGGPKPTTFQHYLTQQRPNPVPTGGRFADGSPRTKLELSDYAAATPDETVLRGHKLYWHKGDVGVDDIQEQGQISERDTQHTLVRPVKSGVSFKFEVRFENLSDIELGALLWVLDKGQDDAYRLKLGMGKPYGLGAVQVTSTLHLQDRRQWYGALFGECGWAAMPIADDEIGTSAREAFERFVLDGLAEHGPKQLADLSRIQALLAMLAWPGPPKAETRYLEIERKDPTAKRGKVNEYKDRPVLPEPLAISGAPMSARDEPPPGFKRGKVESFGLGSSRSYGFIVPDGGRGNVFVHMSGLAPGVGTIRAGQIVLFRVVKGPRGPQAEDVRPID